MRWVLMQLVGLFALLVLACAPAQPAAPAPAAQPVAPAAKPAAAQPPAAAAKPAAAQPPAAKPAAPAQPAAGARTQVAPGFEVDAALYEAAKKEGQVAVWIGAQRENEVGAMAREFEKLTGLKVEATRLSAGPMITRLVKEREAKLYTVDVINHGDLGLWQQHKQQKRIIQYIPEGAKKFPAELKDKDGYFFAQTVQAMIIGYNSKVITGGDIPKRFADLTDAKYKSKIATAHPKHSGTGNELVIMITNRLGWAFYEKLKQNELFLVRSQFELNPIAVTGERPVSLGIIEATALADKKDGKPLDVVYPEEGTTVAYTASGIVADAPHPNAAKLFHEWLLSPAGQSLIASWQYLAPHPDTVYPAGRKKLSEMKIVVLSPEEVEQKSTMSRERFSDLFGG